MEAFEQPRPTEQQITAAIDAIKNSSVIEQAKGLAQDYATEALKAVTKLPASPYRNGLKTMVELITDRNF